MFRLFSLNFLFYLFLFFFFILIIFNNLNIWFFFNVNFFFNFFWNFKFMFFFDNLSLLFSLLSIFLILVCVLWYWNISYLSFNFFLINIIAIFSLLQIFLTINFLYFFFFYEFISIPMLFFISLWGLRERKYLAGNLLFLYTLFGSFFIFLVIFFYFFLSGTFNMFFFYSLDFFEDIEKLFFIFIFFGFAIKVPIIPLHLWLPEAHVEATTPGSVLLAGIILKLSVYIFFRLLISFNFGWYYWLDFIIIIALLGFYIPGLVAFVQIDIKKIIAYSSISHMNFALIGFFEKSILGFCGSIFMLFGHAFVASALFLSVGSIYERYKSRILYYYGGLAILMPLWSFFFFIFILGNFGFPGTVNFIGEFMILYSGLNYSYLFFIFGFLGMLLTLIYSLFLYVRLAKGFILIEFIRYFSDLSRREFYIFFIFFFFCIFFGVFPFFLFDFFFYLCLIFIL